MQKGKHTLCLVIVWGLLSFIFYTAVARSWNSVFKPVGWGQVCQRAHWSTAVQNKTKLWLSPGHHLQNYLIHFALLSSSESAWTLIALFPESSFPKLIFQASFLSRNSLWFTLTLTFLWDLLHLHLSFLSLALTNGKLYFSCHDLARVAIFSLQFILCQDHKEQDSQSYL